MNDFAKVTSKTNINMRGRYTVAPWLPQLDAVAKEVQHGFMEFSDSLFFYGV